jgi:formylglycine-generating enzyme required for sulfatase activity
MNVSQIKKAIKDAIAKDLKTGLDALQSALKQDAPAYNEVLHQLGRWNSLQSEIHRQVITHSEADITRNQIRLALLNYLEESEIQDYNWQTRNQEIFPEMILVQGGEFEMGNIGEQHEEPQHRVQVSSFEIGKYLVKNVQYAAFLNAYGNPELNKWIELNERFGTEKSRIGQTGETFYVENGYEDHPVNFVSWYGAQAYCQWLSQHTGQHFRLPREAEWEFAARGGIHSEGCTYAGSDDPFEVAWFRENADEHAHPVGRKKPNALGLYDMSGNMREWCQDWYAGNYYRQCAEKGLVTDPQGPKNGKFRIYRGGCWYFDAPAIRIAARLWKTPDSRHLNHGLRVVRRV